MENQMTETKNNQLKKVKIKATTESLRVKRETKKRVMAELATLNKKDFGKPVTPDQLVSLAISLLKPEHLQGLKDQSLSNKDRLDQKYIEYCAQNGKISKDEYIGILLNQKP